MSEQVQDTRTRDALHAFCAPAGSPYHFTAIGSGSTVSIDPTPAAIMEATSFHCGDGVAVSLGQLLSSDPIELPKDFGLSAEAQGPKVSGPAFVPKPQGPK
jgi:hypothetical protein